jgi:hypothetical protein
MKLTNKQIEALFILREENSISKDDHRVHNNTMNALHAKDLVQLPRYANGEFWELTDKGIQIVEE